MLVKFRAHVLRQIQYYSKGVYRPPAKNPMDETMHPAFSLPLTGSTYHLRSV